MMKSLASVIAVCIVGAVLVFWPVTAFGVDGATSGANGAKAVSPSKEEATTHTPGKSTAPVKSDAEVIAEQKGTYPLDKCVVSGEKLGAMGPAVDYVYKGRVIRFCCKGCIPTFEKEPAKYLSKLDEAVKKAGTTSKEQPAAPAAQDKPATAPKEETKPTVATIWTCSMHPEVRESKPGKCPKCGMNLVKAS